MSPNETYVLEALQSKFGGNFSDGEDPPDAYLYIKDMKIAVEVTRLVEQVRNKSGVVVSRMSHDVPAVNLSNEIDGEVQKLILNGKYVLLIIPAPINSIRKTKEKLISIILDHIQTNLIKSDVEIEGNLISICVYDGDRESGKKVIGAVSNRYSSADIGKNTKRLLRDRILSKTKKCLPISGIDYWLALYNDYWIADIESYRNAYKQIDIQHNFKKIFIVNGHGEVFLL